MQISPANISINLDNLSFNYNKILSKLSKSTNFTAMVKSDAYGHGVIECCDRLYKDGCRSFGVAYLSEAYSLYNYLPNDADILCMESIWDKEEVINALSKNISISVTDHEQIKLYEGIDGFGRDILLKVNTGMNRFGISIDDLKYIYSYLVKCNFKPIIVLHYSHANNSLGEKFTKEQIYLQERISHIIPEAKISTGGSALLDSYPSVVDKSDYFRSGIMLYGIYPQTNYTDYLRQVMTLEASVIFIRNISPGECSGYSQSFKAREDTRLAILNIGYGHGYPDNCKGMRVMINGINHNVVSNACMDCIIVDIAESEVNIGDRAILWGEELTINNIVSNTNLNPYALTTQLTKRIERFFRFLT